MFLQIQLYINSLTGYIWEGILKEKKSVHFYFTHPAYTVLKVFLQENTTQC